MARRDFQKPVKSASPTTILRRSERFRRRESAIERRDSCQRHPLPSPTSCTSSARALSRKRQRGVLDELAEERGSTKRRQTARESFRAQPVTHNPVAYWVATSTWPDPTSEEAAMATADVRRNNRRSSSSHHSDRRERLEDNGIYMKTSVLLRRESKEFCNVLLTGDHIPVPNPGYPAEKTDDVLERISGLNEARLQRDVTPWVVPSVENLFFSGCVEYAYLGEEVQAEWMRCEPMGVSRPKPDFVVGLRRAAFEKHELIKLDNYATPQGPFHFTPDLCFPFLTCEAKTGQVGLDQAHVQNIHSASIAVRAIVKLFVAVYGRGHERTENLLGRILVFSLSHNNEQVNLYGHYAVVHNNSGGGAEDFEYFRYGIANFNFTPYDGRERYKAYSFTKNLYDKFAPQHLARIREAVSRMADPVPRTGLSFDASEITLDYENSQQDSELTASHGDDVFKTPSEPASVSQKRENRQMKEQLENMERILEQLRRDNREQLDQQRKDSREQLEQQRKDSREQLEQQRKESRDREEKMEWQLEQQKKESRDQLAQLKDVLSRP
ncbi:hypothetical protein BAUCODRAFT_32978 [Baudoinia panamericana UAMH 10762]|uniref:DUF7924 domain-containing protein n=1 Tax=Baudoinia panamericana (strain UAMH 10762) TaxID=717646 RepID=M2NDD4_BAUPA|nr:uncharacterized protein BAUCODRAFT_32978 [Baudoinia panamericana UAMH 10762]EMC97234.1 hypothetical protein BAUCODRAFT_32978 [Baudoinia panamericana UAMH 10762]